MTVMHWGMEQNLPRRRFFNLTLILIPLGFSSDIPTVFEGQIIQRGIPPQQDKSEKECHRTTECLTHSGWPSDHP